MEYLFLFPRKYHLQEKHTTDTQILSFQIILQSNLPGTYFDLSLGKQHPSAFANCSRSFEQEVSCNSDS